MTDKELLELAAKAAGYTLKYGDVYSLGDGEVDCTDLAYVVSGHPDEADWLWCPLEDDGDALRLAVKLGLDVCIDTQLEPDPSTHVVGFPDHTSRTIDDVVHHNGDPYAATRRAITRAAAEIGKTK
jgi:hypothetical protein